MNDIMKSISINNTEVLEILEEAKDIWWNRLDVLQEKYKLNFESDNREEYISDDYRNKIINMGTAHEGYPDSIKSYAIKRVTSAEPNRSDYKLNYDPAINAEWISLNEKLMTTIGSNRLALATVYPPGGYIAWHNNANAPGYNVIFTWSENGNGYWKHVDPYTGKDVLVQDVPGWQAKSFYFGTYEDGNEKIVYHMASTDCWRMTIGYMFDRHHKQYWEDMIEELEMS